MANIVLGHYPDYLRVAEALHGARQFSVDSSRWKQMSQSDRWSANVEFLRSAIAADGRFVFSHAPDRARRGSSFFREVAFLRSQSVRLAPRLPAYVVAR